MRIKPGLDTFLQLGTGAITRTFQEVLRETVRATDFTGTDAGQKIAAAVAALPATGGTVDARGLEGAQTISSTITISKPVRLLLGAMTLTGSVSPWFSATSALSVEGISKITTVLTQTNLTGNLFTIATTSPFHLRNVSLISAGQTAGAFVSLTGTGGASANAHSVIDECVFQSHYIGIDIIVAEALQVKGTQFNDARYRSIRYDNTSNPDQGDFFIGPDNTFASNDTPPDTAAIEFRRGSGIDIKGNKFFRHKYGVLMNWGDGIGGQAIITGNRFEAFHAGGAGISLQRQSGATGAFAGIVISNNWMRADATESGNPIDIPTNAALWVSQVLIAGNQIFTGPVSTGINIGNAAASAVSITGNQIYGEVSAEKGIVIGTGIAQSKVWGNQVLANTSLVIGSTMRGNYEWDNVFVGAADISGATLTNPFNVLNNTYYASRNAASSAWQRLIGQNASNQVSIAPDVQATIFGGELILGPAAFTGGSLGTTAGGGLIVAGKTGSSTDVVVLNGVTGTVFDVPTGTTNTRFNGKILARQYTFATLPTPSNGGIVFCSDCNATCSAGGGTGRMCFGESGAWVR